MAAQNADKQWEGITGSCACGRISFRANKPALWSSYCYCIFCAKTSGAGFLPFVTLEESDLTWSRTPDIWKSSNIAERGHCSECGSILMQKVYLETGQVSIVVGAIDETSTPLPPPRSHIFVGEKLDWVTIPDDGAKRYEGFPPAFQTEVDKWKREHE